MKMLRLLSVSLCVTLLTALFAVPLNASAAYTLPDTVSVSAKSALVMSLGATAEEDTVLFERHADQKLSPAAVVRVMVGALAIDMIREKGLDMDTATGTYTAACDAVITGTGLAVAGMSLANKETWTLRALVTAALILPAADACVTLAVTLAGSNAAFVAKMNAKAKELGCTGTTFANVHGLDAANQQTTVHDLYRITRYAMEFAEFTEIMALKQYTIQPVSGGKERTMVNQNAAIRASGSYYYAPMEFGRTGNSDHSGLAMVSVAKDSGYVYMAIVLGSSGEGAKANTAHYVDTRALYQWAFNAFSWKTLLSKNEPLAEVKVRLSWDKDAISLVPAEEFATVVANELDSTTVRREITRYEETVDAPVKKGTPLGKVELFINLDQKIGEVELVASEDVERSQLLELWERLLSFLRSPWFFGGLGLLALLLIGYVILTVAHNRKRRRRRMKRVTKYK